MRFECTDCGQKLEIQTVFAGQSIACPMCNAALTVPASQPQQAPVPAKSEAFIKTIIESAQSGANTTGVTISKYMADQKLSGGIELESPSGGDRSDVPGVLAPRRDKRYDIGETIAQGGMGAILNAKDVNIRRRVAMKVMLDQKSASRDVILRFIEEAQITGQLEHPGIVPLHELGIDSDANIFYTMTLLKGRTLHDILNGIRSGDKKTIAEYPLTQLLIVFQKICDAMAFAHSKRVIHRDLKPENIMIGDYGEVQVMDWGLAKVLPRKKRKTFARDEGGRMKLEKGGRQELQVSGVPVHRSLSEGGSPHPSVSVDSVRKDAGTDMLKTMDGAIMGTPGFMSPEQALGKTEEIDERTDIYALGAILYNILTLRVPIEGDDLDEVLKKITTGVIPKPTSFNAGGKTSRSTEPKRGGDTTGVINLSHLPDRRVPESLSAVCMKALNVNPWKRYQWVKELQKDIEAYQSGFATRAEDAGMVRQMGLLVRRHKMLTFTVMSIFAAIFTASVVGTTQWIKAEQSRKTAEHQRELARDALTALKGSAPDMALLATRYISTQQPEEALKRICFAVEMRPGNADYLCLRGNVLQTMRRLDEARECYRQALKSDPNHKMAQANLELCTQVLARNGKNKDLSAAALRDLYVGISAQNRFDDALLVLGKGRTLESVMRQMLQKSRIYCKNLSVDDKGLCAVDLSNTSVSDLSPLKDIPISRLNLMRTSIFDLSPLKSLPLTSLNIAYTKISDLSPLRGMRLTELNIGQTWVKDISPVKGMPLKFLNLDSLPVKDLSIVKGMPLERLGVHRTDVTDLSPLKDMPLAKLNMIGTQITDLSPLRSTPLRILCIDRNSPADLSALKGMTTLTFFSEYGEGGGDDVALGMLNPAITALDKKDLSRARKEAETVMRDWRGVPAMIPALNAARWMLDFSIPMIEKPNDFPPRALTYEGHHYCDYYLPMKWDDAKKFCESLGGHLVTVASDDEWRWLLDAFPDHTGMWLGGYLDKQAGKWKWVTGEQWNFTDWSTNQPDNHENSEDVVQIFDDNRFNDTKRDRPERFIIEWDR